MIIGHNEILKMFRRFSEYSCLLGEDKKNDATNETFKDCLFKPIEPKKKVIKKLGLPVPKIFICFRNIVKSWRNIKKF